MATFHDVPELRDHPEMAAFKKKWGESESAYVKEHGIDLLFGDEERKDQEAKAAFFINRNKNIAGLKELLLPLITQALKESTK